MLKKIDLNVCYEEFEEYMLPNSLIIGDDPGSGLIVITIDAEHDGVYYWNHFFYFPQSSDDENTFKIADSFKDIINRLKNPKS